jgi:mono/diheme cytochrome c family protein
MRIWAMALVLIGVMTGVAAWVWWPRGYGINPQDARQVALGFDLYHQHCSSCHGNDLRGEPNWQMRKPNGELPAPPHDASGHTWHHSDEQLFAIVKHGMARFAPPGYKTAMPAYVGKLSDADIKAVLAYIESSWPPEIRDRRAAMLKN